MPDLTAIHAQAMQDFNAIISVVKDERERCLAERRFYTIPEAQWEDNQEQFANKPKFVVNKIHLAVMRIITEYRNNRIAVSFVPTNGEDDDITEVCAGLFRADEKRSGAQEAYDLALEEAVGGGYGAFRLRAEYVDEGDEDDDRQQIAIEPITDADMTVFFDIGAKRQDKSDAKHCFVINAWSRKDYEEEFKDSPSSWDSPIVSKGFEWVTTDVVNVAEYYVVETKTETIIFYQTLTGEEEKYTKTELEENPELLQKIISTGGTKIKEKKVKRRKIHKYLLSGHSVIEDCGIIPGDNIPIIPVYGKRWFIDGVERCSGHVRLGIDAQKIKNMQVSLLVAQAMQSSSTKPIFFPEQIQGWENIWAQDNVKNYPYLPINPMIDNSGNPMPLGPVAYTQSPVISPAMTALLQITDQDILDLMGNQQQADKLLSGVSEKTVQLVQNRVDMQSFVYLDNMAIAVRRAGEVWLSMAAEVYHEAGRKLKTVGEMGSVESVELLAPVLGKDGGLKYTNDISNAKLEVTVDVGPTSASHRQATVQSLIDMMPLTQDPTTLDVLQSMAMHHMDGEGLKDLREWFRKKLVKQGVFEPNEDEKKAMQASAQKRDPNEVFLEASSHEAEAKAEHARASAQKTLADAKLSTAKTIEILDGLGRDTNMRPPSSLLPNR